MSAEGSARLEVLFAASLVSAVLGSVHAFSIFLVPLEAALGLSRATVSLTYSFALVCLTLTVLAGPAIYARFAPKHIYVTVATLGAAGAWGAGQAAGIGGIWLGYSLAFGVANGLGYGFGLQFAARAWPDRAGFAMGVVTAAYALGAALAGRAFEALVAIGGFSSAMTVLALTVLGTGLLAAWIVARSGAGYADATDAVIKTRITSRHLIVIWLAYGLGVAAGLMAIGHAAGLATIAGFTGWHAPAILACCNLCGSLAAGALTDKSPPRHLLPALTILSAVGLAWLAISPSATLLALGLVGFSYGGIIAAYPAAIARRFPGDAGPRVYGRVFTAWGVAGLTAPWVAGAIFDATGGYGSALWLASALSLGAAALAGQAFRQG